MHSHLARFTDVIFSGSLLTIANEPKPQYSFDKISIPAARADGPHRAEKLKAEPDFAAPVSDGHMTGYAIVVLREAGVPATDPRIQRGLVWLKANQRESGRWWTRSLNTDSWHFITYSGTAFPLLALAMCDELPRHAGADGPRR